MRVCEVNLAADNAGASVESKHVADARFAFTLDHDLQATNNETLVANHVTRGNTNHVGDLNHGVNLGLGENSLAACALDIKTQDAKRGNLINAKTKE